MPFGYPEKMLQRFVEFPRIEQAFRDECIGREDGGIELFNQKVADGHACFGEDRKNAMSQNSRSRILCLSYEALRDCNGDFIVSLASSGGYNVGGTLETFLAIFEKGS